MIRYEEKINIAPYGRDVKELKADFIGGECPSWLVLPNGVTYSNNGVDIPASTVIKTISMPIKEMDAIGFQLNNLRLGGNERQNPYPSLSIKLIHEDSNGEEAESIGLYGANKANYFTYNIGGTDVYTDNNVGVYLGNANYSLLVTTDLTPVNTSNYYRYFYYSSRPKNLGVRILPIMGCLDFFFNDIPIYSNFNLDKIEYETGGVSHTGVDFTAGVDKWHFEVTSNRVIHISSVDFSVHQSY